MSKPTLLLLDTLDDRREIWHLLHRLSPWDRVRFLKQSCDRVAGGHKPRPSLHRMRPRIEAAYRCGQADRQLTNEVYGDLLAMASQYDLDLLTTATTLERLVRGVGSRV